MEEVGFISGDYRLRVSRALLYCIEVPIYLINRYVRPIRSISYKTNDRPVDRPRRGAETQQYLLSTAAQENPLCLDCYCVVAVAVLYFAVHCFSPLPSPCRRSRSIILIKPLLMRGKMARPRTEWDSVQYGQVILKLHMEVGWPWETIANLRKIIRGLI